MSSYWSGPTSPTGDRPRKPRTFINPWSPTAGTRPPLLPTTPTTRTPTSTSAPADPYAGVQAQIDAMLKTYLDAVEREKQAAYQQMQREAAMELQRGQALAEGLKALGISDAVQKAFGNAATAQAGLAQGFSGQIRDQAAAQAAEQQQMLSGTGQEGAVRNQGEAMGNVQYGLGGYMPGTALNTMAAAFGADAALQPGFAMQFGAMNEAARRAKWADEELPQFTNRRLEILDKKPELLRDAIGDYEKARAKATTKSGKATIRTLANGQLQAFNAAGKPVGKPYGPAKPTKAAAAEKPVKLQARTVNGQVYWFNPYTGEQVGKKYGKADTGASSSKSGSKPWIQILPNGDGTYTRYDMRSGKKLGTMGTPYKTDTPSTKRPDGMTPAALRRARADAFSTVKGWKANGMADDEGNPYRAQDLLKYMTQDKQIPFDIAVRTLAKFYKPARKWFKNKPTPTDSEGVQIPASIRSTHPTDNLDGFPAVDIMGKPGTPVKAPEDGVVIRHGSAQGGEALYFQGRSGKVYWLGHIDGMAPVGTRVRRGQSIAVIADQNVSAPHVHVGINSSGARV